MLKDKQTAMKDMGKEIQDIQDEPNIKKMNFELERLGIRIRKPYRRTRNKSQPHQGAHCGRRENTRARVE